MKFPLLGKLGALGAVMVALVFGLDAIGSVVREREGRQEEAEQSVADGSAGSQMVLGPVLQRRCHEAWRRTEGEGKDRKVVAERRDFVLTAWPRSLNVTSNVGIEPRYRGIFTLNTFVSKTAIAADFADLSALLPRAEQPEGQVTCDLPTVAVAVTDARGIQAASIAIGEERLAILPGTLLEANARGFHAVLPDRGAAMAAALHLDITLDLAGTRSVEWVPVGDDTKIQMASSWPHPSFNGRFLPTQREVTPQGFQARWQVSSLATTAQQFAATDAPTCEYRNPLANVYSRIEPKEHCIDSFGVAFIDPVNGYMLGHRALKYGLLFIALTFVGVALVEVMRRVRVHPAQYLLVGGALTMFFLLLVSLGEHMAFGWAYLCASAACTVLLTFYAHHILRGLRAGASFGAGIALLYGALYALLCMEQTALVLGAMLLFAVLSAVMVATRRVDWYALTAQLREDAAPRAPNLVAASTDTSV